MFAAAWQRLPADFARGIYPLMIRKPKSGEYCLYSRNEDASKGDTCDLWAFKTLGNAKQHEYEIVGPSVCLITANIPSLSS